MAYDQNGNPIVYRDASDGFIMFAGVVMVMAVLGAVGWLVFLVDVSRVV